MSVRFACKRYNARLGPYGEGALPEGEAAKVGAHLAACPRCREDFETLREMGDLLRAYRPSAPEPAADLWSRVQAEITPAPAPARIPWWRTGLALPVGGLAAAAFAVCAVMVARPSEGPHREAEAVTPGPAAAVRSAAPGSLKAGAPQRPEARAAAKGAAAGRAALARKEAPPRAAAPVPENAGVEDPFLPREKRAGTPVALAPPAGKQPKGLRPGAAPAPAAGAASRQAAPAAVAKAKPRPQPARKRDVIARNDPAASYPFFLDGATDGNIAAAADAHGLQDLAAPDATTEKDRADAFVLKAPPAAADTARGARAVPAAAASLADARGGGAGEGQPDAGPPVASPREVPASGSAVGEIAKAQRQLSLFRSAK